MTPTTDYLPLDGRTLPTVLDARVVSGAGGGPDKTLLNSPRFLTGLGYRMACAYLHHPDDPGFATIRRRAAEKQAPLISVPDRGPLDWRVVPRLVEVCRRERVAIWHGHDYKTNLLGLVLRKFWPMRLVTTVHGWVEFTPRTSAYYMLDRMSLRHYERVISVSDDLDRRCRQSGVAANRCHLLPNGIDLDDYRRTSTPEEAKRRLGLDPGRLLVGAVGRLSPEKGFHLLIPALAELIRAGLPVDLAVFGEGPQRAELEALIAKSGCGNRLRLMGFGHRLQPWYEAFDLFALSSEREGLPNVVLEAMAMETPVLATAVNGLPKLIDPERDGWLVEPGSIPMLKESIGRVLALPEERRRRAAAARAKVERSYGFRARMERLAGIYDTLLGRGCQ